MEERTKSRPWIVGVVGLALIVGMVVRSARRQSREPAPLPVATLEIDGKTLEITTTLPGATVQPVLEREEVAGRAGIVAETSSEPEDLLVEVVRPDGGPAAGATVAMLDALRVFVHSEGPEPEPGDPLDAFDLALRVTADAHGRARLPRPRGEARLAAWLEWSFAELRLFPGEPGPLRLELIEDPPIEVRVVGEDGRPLAGIPVALRTAKSVVATRRTREDGLVLLFARGRRAELEQGEAFVQLGVPLREAVFARVNAVRDGPIELVSPALGAVEVRLTVGGAEAQEAAPVTIGIRDGLREELAHEVQLTSILEGLAHDGRATFAHVGLGLELFAMVTPMQRPETGNEFAGPARAGEVVVLAFELAERSVRLTGRLLGADHAALGEVEAELRLNWPGGSWGRRVLTDPEGAFFVDYPEQVDTTESLAVAVLAPARSAHAATFPVRLRPGDNDLGELVLAPLPLLVSGRVRDEAGNVLKGLVVEAWKSFDAASGRMGEPLLKAVTDAAGRFEMHRAPPEAGGLALKIRKSGLRFGPESVVAGTEGLEIVVRATGSIALQVLCEGLWFPNVRLLQAGVPLPFPEQSHGGGAGKLSVDALLPGEYDLEWSHPWASERGFVRVVRVVAGARTTDPRLDPLDLRGAWPRVRLRIEDEAGAPVAGARLELWRDGSYAPYTMKPGRSELDVVAGPLPLRARLSAPGYRTRELELDADATVVLTRGPRLELAAPTLPELPRDWEWAVWIRSVSRRQVRPTPITLQSGVNELTLELSGAHELWVGAVRRHGNWNDEVGGGPELEFVVEEGLTTVTLEPLDASQVDAVRAGIAAEDPFAPR